MTNYFNSGLYGEQFYKKHTIDFGFNDNVYEDIEYNRELLAEYYEIEPDRNNSDEDDVWEQVEEHFWSALRYWIVYFEPLIFDEAIAVECGLVPFSYQEIKMLALGGCGMDLSPKLDAYQALTHKTIDRNSRLFSRDNTCGKYFEYVVGETVMQKVLKAIS